MEYYNAVRTHLSLGKDAPNGRAIQHHGRDERWACAWWVAPSVCSDLIRGRDRQVAAAAGGDARPSISKPRRPVICNFLIQFPFGTVIPRAPRVTRDNGALSSASIVDDPFKIPREPVEPRYAVDNGAYGEEIANNGEGRCQLHFGPPCQFRFRPRLAASSPRLRRKS